MLLAQSEQGYLNLCELSSLAYLEIEASEEPHVPWELADVSEPWIDDVPALQGSQEMFRMITDNVSDMIALLDLDGRRRYNSASYARVRSNEPLPGAVRKLVARTID